jgi:hypothetical protein
MIDKIYQNTWGGVNPKAGGLAGDHSIDCRQVGRADILSLTSFAAICYMSAKTNGFTRLITLCHTPISNHLFPLCQRALDGHDRSVAV